MNDTIDLRQYIAIGLKWWWLFLLFTVLAAATGYYVSQQEPRVYEATTTIMVGQSIQQTDLSTSDLFLSERLASTYADIAQRQPVLQAVVDRLSLDTSWQGLRDRVAVSPVRDTQLLQITVEARSPEEARVTADEVARQLIRLSPTTAQDAQQAAHQQFTEQRLAELQSRINAGQDQLDSLEAAMSGSLSIERANELQTEIKELQQLIAEWESNYAQLRSLMEGERSPNFLAVIEPAQGSSQPVRPQTSQDTMLAAVVGLLLAGGLVFLLEYLDDTIKSKDDVSQVLGLSPLGAVSQIQGKDREDRLLSAEDAFSPVGEAYRMIRSNIRFMSVDHAAKAIVITSPVSSEGKSTTAANLAVVMAQVGLKTILVDADLRRPTQHEIFQIPESHVLLGGLTDLLCEPEAEVASYLRKTKVENLRLITSGLLPPNPSELLDSQRMGQLINQLTEVADAVIFDSPPAAVVTDAAVLSSKSDGVILVVEAGRTRLGAARQALLNLQQGGAHLLGSILNRASAKAGGYYYYYQTYYSGNNTQPGRREKGQPPRHRKPRWRQWLPFVR